MHQRGVYQRKIHTIDELKQRLEQLTVDMAIDQWHKKLELVFVRQEGTSNTVFELIDCLDFVNFLSPSLSCFA